MALRRGKFNGKSDFRAGKEISPIYFITATMPSTLLAHGDADPRAPVRQSQTFVERATAAGANIKLIIKPGGGHGWPDQGPGVVAFADWFDPYLRGG
jgi:dipeptidyl aminopeptidase/acylaminoacyl peptidase